MSNKSVIVDAVRSPIGIKNGQLVGMRPDDLAAQVVKGLLKRNPNLKPEKSQTYEAGIDYSKNMLNTSLTYFYTDFTDKIETTPGSAADEMTWKNLAKRY